jgi:hypothetical protein
MIALSADRLKYSSRCPRGNALTLAAVALIAFAALIPVERAAREPVISPALFGTRQLVVTYTLELLIGIAKAEFRPERRRGAGPRRGPPARRRARLRA